jgi:cysteinyl-tRNA synthetase
MAMQYLGNAVDVHGGGADLAFPHHESEIAQAESVTGQSPFVRFWLHTAMVHHEGEKMSKSLGNLVMVRDLLETWSPDALRLYLARYHYRESWSYDVEELEAARRLAEKLQAAVTVVGGAGASLDPTPAQSAFVEAMDEDLQTPLALVALKRLAEETLLTARVGGDVKKAQAVIRTIGQVLGLRLDAAGPEERVVAGWNQHLSRFLSETAEPVKAEASR